MTKTCPACGFVSATEARFCRMCGAMLPRAAEDDAAVSPLAATIPLAAERTTSTDELSPHDTGSPNRPRTSSITSEEMADFLRRGGEPSAAPRAAAADSPRTPPGGAHDPSDELGARPLTISVRPIDPTGADTSAVTPDPPPRHDSPRPAETNPNLSPSLSPSPNLSAPLVADSGARAAPPVAPVAPDDEDERTVVSANPRAARSTEDRAIRLWAGAAVFGVVALVTAAAVLLAWLAVQRYRRAHAPGAAPTAASAPATDEARRSASSKLAEADQLLAAGRADEAVARLREAAAADPSNAEPHRRLARLLVEEGARRTAIEELKAVVRLDPADAAAWRSLAAAQSAEGLYADAAESYHNLFGVAPEATGDDQLQLAYADALRASDRVAQAHSIYRRLASSRDAGVARASREQLAAAGADGAKNANDPADSARAAEASSANSSGDAPQPPRAGVEVARAGDAGKNSAAPPAPPAALPADASPKDHYERGSQLWRANRAAALAEFAAAAGGGNSDANYYLGLNLAEGRDPRTLKRGELVAALSYFQRARRGHFSAEARRYEDALGREYDRRRAGGQN
jgi:tetratricopeptide (TPR) repeat protein